MKRKIESGLLKRYLKKNMIGTRIKRIDFIIKTTLEKDLKDFDLNKYDISGIRLRRSLKSLREYIKETEDLIQELRRSRKQQKIDRIESNKKLIDMRNLEKS